MILSIGMIVRNEAEDMLRCMEALKPLLGIVESELIIADMGCSDGTVEVAQKFANGIIPFEQYGDFTAVANFLLGQAQGEWFMPLNADMVLEDIGSITEFFVSGEYKEYGSAVCAVQAGKNGGTLYGGTSFLKLAKITPDLRFSGGLFERLTNMEVPIKTLSALRRTGMDPFTETDDEIGAGAERFSRLSREYFTDGDFKAALEYADRGLDCVGEDAGIRRELIIQKACALYAAGDTDGSLAAIDEGIVTQDKPEPELFRIKGLICSESGKQNESIAALTKYAEICDASDPAAEAGHGDALLRLAAALAAEGDCASARRWLCAITSSGLDDSARYTGRRLALELETMERLSDWSGLGPLYGRLEGKAAEELILRIENALASGKNTASIAEAFAGPEAGHTEYGRLMSLRHCYLDGAGAEKKAVEFATGTENWRPLFADALYIALDSGCPINLLSAKIDAYSLNVLLFESRFLHFKNLTEVIFSLSQQNEIENVRDAQFLGVLYLWALTSGELDGDKTVKLFRVYSETASWYLSSVFTEEALTPDTANLLPELERVGLHCHLAMESPDVRQKGEHLIAAVRLFPKLDGAAKLMLSEFQKEWEASSAMSEAAELEKCAAIVKKNIRRLIGEGSLTEARQILDSYAQLCPDDAELISLRKSLRS